MKRIGFLLLAVAIFAGVVVNTAPASGQTDGEGAPIYGVKIPSAYRDWTMLSAALVGGPVHDLRVKLGNDVAIKAYREDKRPFRMGRSLPASPISRSRSKKTTKSFALLLSSAACRLNR